MFFCTFQLPFSFICKYFLIQQCHPMLGMICLKTHLYLIFCILAFIQQRQLIQCKIATVHRFYIFLEMSSDHSAEHKNLAYFVCITRQIVFIPVLNGNYQICRHIQTSFFLTSFTAFSLIDRSTSTQPPGSDHFPSFSFTSRILSFSNMAALVSSFGV